LSASSALFEQSALLIASETQRNDPFRLQTIPGLFSTLKAATKQGAIETQEPGQSHDWQLGNMATHPRFTHIEECGGGSNVEQTIVFVGRKWDGRPTRAGTQCHAILVCAGSRKTRIAQINGTVN